MAPRVLGAGLAGLAALTMLLAPVRAQESTTPTRAPTTSPTTVPTVAPSPSPAASPTPAPAPTPSPAPTPTRPPTPSAAPPPVEPARPVHDASNWAAVTGPLRSLWEKWKADEASKGVIWDDMGHITNIEGATIVSSYRADSVPPAAVAFMVAHAAEAGLLVAGDPGSAASMAAQEAARVQAANDAARDAAEKAKEAAEKAAGAANPSGQPTPGPSGTNPGASGPAGTSGGTNPTGTTPNPNDPQGTTPTGDSPAPNPSGEPVPDLTQVPPPPTVDPGAALGDRENIPYGNEHPRQVLDLYMPPNLPQGAAVPVIVFFHGGGFYRGDKKDCRDFLPVLDQGYALASCNYKLLQKASFDQIDFMSDVGEIAKAAFDARKAVRFLKDNAAKYGLDANKFAAVGASAGGYLAAAVGACGNAGSLNGESGAGGTSPAVQAVIDWSGPTNFATFMEHKNGSAPYPTDMATQLLNSRGAISPFDYVNGGDPPHLIRHGEQDPVVPFRQSTTYADKLKGAGVRVDIKTYPNLAHEPDPAFIGAEVQASIDFLNSILK